MIRPTNEKYFVQSQLTGLHCANWDGNTVSEMNDAKPESTILT